MLYTRQLFEKDLVLAGTSPVAGSTFFAFSGSGRTPRFKTASSAPNVEPLAKRRSHRLALVHQKLFAELAGA
ncbi:hypothetical protein AN936_18095 [Sphingopyxis macrogoltabida]|uniref:Uncharacterized protein n=1 Tax=Sphingopyxis macrogoltabida TaxID=33050 RepID=A0A0N7GT08_SPHMC|nr:hypothetical protein AN936_18095 [Sphingopyxis macrogoltabida]